MVDCFSAAGRAPLCRQQQKEDENRCRMQNAVKRAVEAKWFQYSITAAIVANAVTLGLETVPAVLRVWGDALRVIDIAFVALFTLEIVLKLYAWRFSFWKSGWNVFDFLIVAVTLVPFFGNLSVLRALRILRVLRLISVVPQFRRVVQGFFDSLSGLAAVGGIMLIVFYVAAVMATKMFGASFPEWFGSIPHSLYSLFQIMTLESWSMGIVRPVMEVYPYAWAFFVPFVMVTAFAVLNLLIGIIVNSMQNVHDAEEKRLTAKLDAQSQALIAKIDAMQEGLGEMRKELTRHNR